LKKEKQYGDYADSIPHTSLSPTLCFYHLMLLFFRTRPRGKFDTHIDVREKEKKEKTGENKRKYIYGCFFFVQIING